jgi:hypothetical protein
MERISRRVGTVPLLSPKPAERVKEHRTFLLRALRRAGFSHLILARPELIRDDYFWSLKSNGPSYRPFTHGDRHGHATTVDTLSMTGLANGLHGANKC